MRNKIFLITIVTMMFFSVLTVAEATLDDEVESNALLDVIKENTETPEKGILLPDNNTSVEMDDIEVKQDPIIYEVNTKNKKSHSEKNTKVDKTKVDKTMKQGRKDKKLLNEKNKKMNKWLEENADSDVEQDLILDD